MNNRDRKRDKGRPARRKPELKAEEIGAATPSGSERTEKIKIRQLVEDYARDLNIARGDIVTIAGLHNSQFSDFEDRNASREHVCRIAWALAAVSEITGREAERRPAQGAAEKPSKIVEALGKLNSLSPRKPLPFGGIVDLDRILNHLLTTAGYAPIIGADTDRIWTDLEIARSRSDPAAKSGKLRVGWGHFEKFSYKNSGQLPRGLALDISVEICKLLGVEMEPVECPFEQLMPALWSREIHVIAPIFNVLPTRLFSAAFSKPIPPPMWQMGLMGLIRKDDLERYLQVKSKLMIHYVRGTIGEVLYRVFDRDARVGNDATDSPGFNTFDDAVLHLSDESPYQEIRCVIGDNAAIATEWRKPRARTLVMVPSRQSQLEFPFAFCLHPSEGKLRAAIDACIEILHASGYFHWLAETPDAKDLALAYEEAARNFERLQDELKGSDLSLAKLSLNRMLHQVGSLNAGPEDVQKVAGMSSEDYKEHLRNRTFMVDNGVLKERAAGGYPLAVTKEQMQELIKYLQAIAPSVGNGMSDC